MLIILNYNCESKIFDHKGFEKPKNFILKDYFDKKKINIFISRKI